MFVAHSAYMAAAVDNLAIASTSTHMMHPQQAPREAFGMFWIRMSETLVSILNKIVPPGQLTGGWLSIWPLLPSGLMLDMRFRLCKCAHVQVQDYACMHS